MSDRRVFRVRIANVRLKPAWRPRVTDHALARYMERVLGVNVTTDDFKKARSDLHGPAVHKAILHGAQAALLDGGVKIVVEGNTVVTVLGQDIRPKKNTKRVLRELSRLNELYPIGDSE